MVDFTIEGLTFSATPATAASLRDGSLDPDVAYMQGRLKVAGDMTAFYGLLPLASSEAFSAALPAEA
jgi:putative sterol carrier protein